MTDWARWFQDSVSQFGDTVQASHYDSPRSFFTQQRVVLNWIGDVRGKTILDLGPGTGHFSQSLVAHNRVIGVDFVPQMLKFCVEKGFLVIQANGMRLPVPSSSMDIIICAGVLQHIDDYPSFLKELLRVRKPDGQLYLTTLNKESLVRRLYYMLTPNVETMHTYEVSKLAQMLQELAPETKVESAMIYYPFPGYRHTDSPIDRLLSTAFTLRVS